MELSYYHIDNLKNIVCTFFYIFHYVSNIFNINMKLMLYLFLVQSIFNYGIVYWEKS